MLIATVIAGLAVLAAFHAFGYCAVCRAFEDMEYNAIGFVFHKVVLLLFLWYGIKMKVGLIGVNVIYLIAALFLWLYYYIVVRVRYIRPRLYFDLGYWKKMLREAFPLGIAAVLRKVSWHVDTLILGAMGTAAAVGLFSGAYKVVQGLNLIPLCFALPLFPVFSRLAQSSTESLFSSYEKALKFLFVVSLPLVVFLTVCSEKIVTLFLGKQFVEATIALQILAWALLFLFPTSLYVYLFTALGKQTLFAVSSAACLGINIVLDVVLIPKYSYVGACIGTLCAEITLFFVGFYFLRRLGSSLSLFRVAWKPLLASLSIGVVLYGLKDSSTAVVIAAAVGGFVIYCMTAVLLKTFTKEEISFFRNSVVMKRNAYRE
jgi:O-antigen/teichoic acid export membrane protein